MSGTVADTMLGSAAPIKRTAVERQVNIQIVFLFVLLLALSIGSTIGSSIREVSVKFKDHISCFSNGIFSGYFQVNNGICSRRQPFQAEVRVSRPLFINSMLITIEFLAKSFIEGEMERAVLVK